jgi:hypothetical protein
MFMCSLIERRHHRDTVALPRWNDHDPTDLEELTHRTTIIIFGSIALAIIVIVLVMLALWIL